MTPCRDRDERLLELKASGTRWARGLVWRPTDWEWHVDHWVVRACGQRDGASTLRSAREPSPGAEGDGSEPEVDHESF